MCRSYARKFDKGVEMSCLEILVAITLHLGLEGDYNNIHPHGRCTIDNWIAGAYYNSEENVSVYVGKIIPNVDYNWDLEIGLVTGYSGMDVAPMIRYINDGWFVSPTYESSFGGNIGLVIGYEFKFGNLKRKKNKLKWTTDESY